MQVAAVWETLGLRHLKQALFSFKNCCISGVIGGKGTTSVMLDRRPYLALPDYVGYLGMYGGGGLTYVVIY